jgi:hypothetical protein
MIKNDDDIFNSVVLTFDGVFKDDISKNIER